MEFGYRICQKTTTEGDDGSTSLICRKAWPAFKGIMWRTLEGFKAGESSEKMGLWVYGLYIRSTWTHPTVAHHDTQTPIDVT